MHMPVLASAGGADVCRVPCLLQEFKRRHAMRVKWSHCEALLLLLDDVYRHRAAQQLAGLRAANSKLSKVRRWLGGRPGQKLLLDSGLAAADVHGCTTPQCWPLTTQSIQAHAQHLP
jgi:hypothetical protein